MKRTSSSLLVVLLLLAISATLFGCAESNEMKAAKAAFTTQTKRVAAQQVELKKKISEGDALVAANNKMLNPELVPKLETSISNGKAEVVSIPEMPKKLEEIIAKTNKLKEINCSTQIAAIDEAEKAVNESIAKFKLVDHPTEAYVIQCLKTIPDVGDIAAATEENDPNESLNKDGMYTAAVFFSSPLVNLKDTGYSKNDSVLTRGTIGGGSVEVYRTVEDAQKREDYLKSMQGNGPLFDPGSHQLIGTVVVRSSMYLTASKQDKIEKEIMDALTKLP